MRLIKFHSLRTKLLLSVSTLVIGSGLAIFLLVINHLSDSRHAATIVQEELTAKAIALEATHKILINDLMALQNLLNHRLRSNPSIAYLFVVKEGLILAHTFSEGIPIDLIGLNTLKNSETGNFKRIVTNGGEHYHDIVWPIFTGKAGMLRLGMTEKSYQTEVAQLGLQIFAFILVILVVSIGASYFFIGRITEPLTVLAKAAEEINVHNLELNVEPAGIDEVGRLTASIEQMVGRLSDYTLRMKQNTQEVLRANRQTRSSFEIIQKIWTQDSITEVSVYLISKFQEIMACQELVLFLFGHRQATLFTFYEDQLSSFKGNVFESVFTVLNGLNGFTYIAHDSIPPEIALPNFQAASQIATFPIDHENQLIGALVIPCPGNCNCDRNELKIISLILKHSSGAIQRAIAYEEEMRGIRKKIEITTEYCGIVGKDPQMQSIYKLIEDIAPSDTTVLIQGESGTGKELVAGAIHQKSLRQNWPLVVINCAAYPANLLESELFGHVKGAFTGAIREKPGRFEQADKGTVFLDEIGEISASAQIKLLRVLQTHKFERVGGEKTLAVDVRILAATNKDLLEEVKKGNFREELYYRLNVIPVRIPPLRKRINDIPLLARFFLRQLAAEQNKSISEFSPEGMRLLLEYHWPGNVRELENCIERAVVLTKGKQIEALDLPSALYRITSSKTAVSQGTIVENEIRLFKKVLQDCNWNKKQAALRLGISRNTLYRKLKKYHIQTPSIQ